MAEINFKIDKPKNFSVQEKNIFLGMIKQQGKIINPKMDRVERCHLLCICKEGEKIVSIGAMKPKSNSDFDSGKADLDKLRNDFTIELGYCFTLPDFTGKGYSSTISKLLLDKFEKDNIMASTELRADNSMTRILERNGFKLFGKPWKSGKHGGTLGLYLKFVK